MIAPMKRRKSGSKKTAKPRGAPKSIDEYFSRLPEPTRGALHRMRAAIRSAVPPEATEVISYGIPAFRHKRVLVWFAAFSNHFSLFPTAAVIETFKKDLKDYTVSKGTVQFAIEKPLPLALIRKLVKARVAQSQEKEKR